MKNKDKHLKVFAKSEFDVLLETMNYNDRLDGYGFGEAESHDSKREYEHDPYFTHHNLGLGEGYREHLNEPYTKDEYGLRNQYGPVDQYVFRDVPFHDNRAEARRDKTRKEETTEGD